MIDVFGFGERRKIKVNRLPDEAPDKAQQQAKAKPKPITGKNDSDRDGGGNEEIKSCKQLEKLLERLYGISALSVYEYDYRQDLIEPKCVYGIEISRLRIEDYISLGAPAVMRKATGFEDAPLYRARYISKYRTDDKEYLVILSSSRFEGFSASVLSNIPVLIRNAIANITR